MDESLRVQAWGGTPKHLKARGIHRGLAIFYAAMAAFVLAVSLANAEGRRAALEFSLFASIPAAIHLVIAYGASKARAWAQVCSVVAALLMLLAVPIGTVIGIYLLRNAAWARPKASPLSAGTPNA